MKPCLIVLSHRGGGFLSEISEACGTLGLDFYILSTGVHPTTTFSRAPIGISLVREEELDLKFIRKTIDSLTDQKFKCLGCISVWEGHRGLMSKANSYLNANDLSEKSIRILQDKYKWRSILRKVGLSTAASFLANRLSEEGFRSKIDRYKNKRWFVKPNIGLGSFGARKWKGESPTQIIKSWTKALKSDDLYRNYLMKHGRLISNVLFEEELRGKEYSFEGLCTKDGIKVLAVHEKISTEEFCGTTIEPGSISPPKSLNLKQLNEGIEWLNSVVDTLDARAGAFHIEAKRTSNGWEMVDFNPRVGGALILESTRRVSGENLLILWIRQLIKLPNKTSNKSVSDSNTKTFFRVYFAEPNKVVDQVSYNLNIKPRPAILNISPIGGKKTPKTVREIFAGQCLWEFAELCPDQFIAETAEAIQVTYKE